MDKTLQTMFICEDTKTALYEQEKTIEKDNSFAKTKNVVKIYTLLLVEQLLRGSISPEDFKNDVLNF